AQIRYGSEVFSPTITDRTAHVLASFEKIEALRYARLLAPGGLAVVSSQVLVPVTVTTGQAKYPMDADARLRATFQNLVLIDAAETAAMLGNPKVAGVVILGAMSDSLDLEETAWRQAIAECVPPKFLAINLSAFDAGRLAGVR